MRRLAGPLALAGTLVLWAGCGPAGSPAPPPPPPSPTFDLLAWEYPGARPVARVDPILAATGKLGTHEIAAEPREATRVKPPALYAYDTPDPLEAVYAFYARKLDLDPEFAPHALQVRDEGLSQATATLYERRDAFPGFRASYTGLEGRQEVRTATLLGPAGPGISAVIVLTRGRLEGYTSIEVVVSAAPTR